MKLSVVIPAHNEQDNIAEVINKIENCLDTEHELVIVNDHCMDATAKIVESLRIKYPNLKLVENNLSQGFANAIKTGLSNVGTELVIPIMGDLCDDLNSIKVMLNKIQGGYDVVCGSRYMSGGGRLGGSRLKAFLSSFAGRSLRYLLNLPTNDITNSFKMYRRNVTDSIGIVNLKSHGFDISMEMALKAYYLGFKITEVPTIWKERSRGKSNFKIFKSLPDYIKLYIWAIYKSYARCVK